MLSIPGSTIAGTIRSPAKGLHCPNRNDLPIHSRLTIPCDDAAAWAVYSGSGTIANDTTNFRCIGDLAKARSVKFTCGTVATANNFDYNHGSTVDVRDTYLFLRYYVHETDWAKLSNQYIYFSHNANPAAVGTSYRIYSRANGYGGGSHVHKGWHSICIPLTAYYQQYGGGADFSLFRYVRLNLNTDAAADVSAITIDKIAFIPCKNEKLYMIRFDDGTTDQYGAACLLDSLNLRASFCCVSSWYNRSGNFSASQLKSMQSMGHLIVNHSYDHTYWYNLTSGQIKNQIRRAGDWFDKNGLPAGSRIIAVPGGFLAEGVIDDLRNETDCFWIVGDVGANVQSGSLYDPRLMVCYNEASYADAAALQTLVETMTVGGIGDYISVLWHVVTGKETKFKTHMEYIAAQRDAGAIKVITPLDLFNGTY
jgi:hypothetical protein